MSLSASTSGGLTRKRVDSTGAESSTRKKPRISLLPSFPSSGGTGGIPSSYDRIPLRRTKFDEVDDFINHISTPNLNRSFSGNSSLTSYTTGSRHASPMFSDISSLMSPVIGGGPMAMRRPIIRSASSMSLYTPEPEHQYPECSAKHALKYRGIVVEYSAPPIADTDISSRLLACSDQNLVFFTRGNRVHFKNIVSNEEVGQLCKLQEKHGDIRSIECGSKDRPELVALGTNKGIIQLWDVNTKKTAMTWLNSAGISAMRWNGSVLTVGSPKGTIRHYDIRVNPVQKMREQSRKLTRHQGKITSLDWNSEGKYLASGDSTGTVYCWAWGEKKPLEIGEFVQRRKKIQHDGAITAINFCPWRPELLSTGDSAGVIRLWNINPKNTLSNATTPGMIETTGAITGLHWSSQCKELLSTHGPTVPTSTDPFIPRKPLVANSLSAYSYPSLRHVTTLHLTDLPESPIGDSVMNANGTKLIFARPGESKLHVCDVWSKRKEIKRQQSFMQNIIR